MSRVAVFGAGYVGLVTGACFADLGHDVVIRDVIPGRIERLRAGEVPIYEPGLEELLRGNAERLTYTLEVAEAVEDADFLYVAVGTPPTYSGDADLSAVWTVVDELGGLDRRAVMVMKSTVPVGTGENVRHRLDARGLENVGYVVQSRVHGRGHGGARLPAPGSDRDRRVRRGRRRGGRAASCRDRRARRPLRRRLGRDDQARRERGADDSDQLHQRDRERLRGNRRRRRPRRRGHRARPAHRLELPARRDRLRRQLLPEGLARAQAARGQLGLPLPAPERRDRGQRAAEAPRDRQAAAAPRQSPRQDGGAARRRLQAEHGRHARGAQPRARGPARGRGRARPGVGPDREDRRPPGGRTGRRPPRLPSPAPTPSCS